MITPFSDHFSKLACCYSDRPDYPEELFEHIATLAPSHGRVWDAGTGGGQAAVRLARYFDEVVATDASLEQIKAARRHPKVRYAVVPSESSGLPERAFDAVTAAQALHWFALEPFYREVRRVLKPGGLLAVWCYGFESVDERVDLVTRKLYSDFLRQFWPERTVKDYTYDALELPFDELPRRMFRMEMVWTLGQFISSLRTYSASRYYKEQNGVDPLNLLAGEFGEAWGDPQQPRLVTWPVYSRYAVVATDGAA